MLARIGMNIAITYKSSSAYAEAALGDLRALGVSAHAIPVDFADASATARAADEMLTIAGGPANLAVLVNSASVFPKTPLAEITPVTWDRILATNLRAPFQLAQRLGLAMRDAGGGKIVNIGDGAGVRPHKDYLPYVVSKAGLLHLTRTLALELAPKVQVNCVCPGPVLLPDGWDEKAQRAVEAKTPLRRMGTPEDIAAAVQLFVAGTDFATGSVLMVDGGRLVADPGG
jgi:pteridine reductase